MNGIGLRQPAQDPWDLSQIGGITAPQNYGLFGSGDLASIGQVTPNVSIGLNPTTGSGIGLAAPTTGFWGNTQSPSGLGSTVSNGDLGFNLGTLKVGVNALAAIGGLYNAFQSNKLAKEQFAFAKDVANTNLNNQVKSYNTALEDRALARGRLNGEADPAAYAAAYYDKNKITRG